MSEPSQGTPSVGDTLAGKYRIDEQLGEGGMGLVFGVTHLQTGRQLAIKWLRPHAAEDPELVARFIREARAVATIEHEDIVDIYDVEQHAGSHFLIMQRLRGEPLDARLARGPMEPAECVRLLLPALEAVAAAHRRGIVHRDLKPENIFLHRRNPDAPERAKVLDFGISKFTEDQAVEALTKTGIIMGTPHYMAPEQIESTRNVDARADVYALGVVLYEALAGRTPFLGNSFPELAIKAMTETPPRPSSLRQGIPGGLETVVMRAMSRGAAERFGDAGELAEALRPHAAEPTRSSATQASRGPSPAAAAVPSRVPAPVLRESLKPSIPGQRRGSSLLLVLLLAASGAAYWLLSRQPEPAPAQAGPGATPGTPAPAPAASPALPAGAAGHAPLAQDAAVPQPGPPPTQRARKPATRRPSAARQRARRPKPAHAEPPAARPVSLPAPARPAVKRAAAVKTVKTAAPAAGTTASPTGRPAAETDPAPPRRRHRSGSMNLDDFE